MDIQPLGMDGLALTRHLRRDSSLRDLPIVAFTASAIKGDEKIARAAGCDGYSNQTDRHSHFREPVAQIRSFLTDYTPGSESASGTISTAFRKASSRSI